MFERGADTLQIPARDLGLQVGARLLDADERGADRDFHHLAGLGIEADVGADAGTLRAGTARGDYRAGVYAVCHERLTESGDKKALEIRQRNVRQVGVHAIRVVTDDLVRCGIDMDESRYHGAGRLDHHARLGTRREGESQQAAVVSRSQLRADAARAPGIQQYRVVVWFCDLVAARKPKTARLEGRLDVVEFGRERHVTVVAHPDRRLMGAD